jgi:hypothetical protein
MVRVFTKCSERTILKLEELTEKGDDREKSTIVNLEEEFSNLALDIIGLGVFNFDFDSVNKESPVIKVGVKTLCSYTRTLSDDHLFLGIACVVWFLKFSKSTEVHPSCIFVMSKRD